MPSDRPQSTEVKLPRRGETYAPQGDQTWAPERRVLRADEALVVYFRGKSTEERRCSFAAWRAWVVKTQARMVAANG